MGTGVFGAVAEKLRLVSWLAATVATAELLGFT